MVLSAKFPAFVLIAASGDVDLATASALRDALRTACATGGHVIVDMGGVTFFDHTGLRECILAQRLCRRAQRMLALANPPAVVRKVVNILDADHVLVMYRSVRAASKALAGVISAARSGGLRTRERGWRSGAALPWRTTDTRH